MNSVANGKVYRQTPFKQLYVQSAAGDAGGAVGAALVVWHELQGKDAPSPRPSPARGEGERRFLMDHAYWGPQFSSEEIGTLLAAKASEISAQGCVVARSEDETALCARTAQAIADCKVVGW